MNYRLFTFLVFICSTNAFGVCILGQTTIKLRTGDGGKVTIVEGALSRYYERINKFRKKYGLKFNEQAYFDMLKKVIFDQIKDDFLKDRNSVYEFKSLQNISFINSVNLSLGISSVVNKKAFYSCLGSLEIESWNFGEANSSELYSKDSSSSEIYSCLRKSVHSFTDDVFPAHPKDFVKSIKSPKNVKNALNLYASILKVKFNYEHFYQAHKGFKL